MRILLPLALLSFGCSFPAANAAEKSTVILQDDFNRKEDDPTKEQIGNDWGTNSRTRAKGQKQVSLIDGAMHIVRAAVADHGVSVTHEAAFADAVIKLRFRIGAKDDLGINIADMKEKSVHAGHICVTRIKPHQVELTDLKTGRMNLARRKRRLANEATEEDAKLIKQKTRRFPIKLDLQQWHDLEVRIVGDELSVAIDGEKIGSFRSEGIAHPTKSRLRLSVNKSAWVDDVTIERLK